MNKEINIGFIGIGTFRAGTTWIFECLKEHPQICGSKKKETKYFADDRIYEQGAEYYKKQFVHCVPNQIAGEFYPGYLYSKKAAERIRNLLPNVKLIACFRNPADRAYSHYLLQKSKKGFKESFREMLEKNGEYIEQGFYFKNLQHYLDKFPRENILLLVYEDIEKDPVKFIQSIYKFLDVDPNFIPPSANKRINFNVDQRYHSLWLKKILSKLLSSKSRLFQFIMRWNTKDKSKLNFADRSRANMPEEDRKFLQKIYAEDIKRMEELLGRSLDMWR